MSKVDRISSTYAERGYSGVAKDIWEYILSQSKVAKPIKDVLGDSLHQKLLVYPELGYWPNISSPRSFNEKLLHRKLHTNQELFSKVEDKYRVREYVENKVGEDILPEIYCVTTDPTEIQFNDLPESFVVKPTHASNRVQIVDDKSTIDRRQFVSTCEQWLSETYGELKNEYWYSDIEPKIIIEEKLSDSNGEIPVDYKFFVFHGEVEFIQVDIDRFSDHSRRLYDQNWNPKDFSLKYPLGPVTDEPENLSSMIEIAEILSEPFDFIRVDLYEPSPDEIVFGELTVAHGSGSERFDPTKFDFKMGEYW